MVTKIIMNVKEEEVVLFDDDILGLLDIIEPPQQNDELIQKIIDASLSVPPPSPLPPQSDNNSSYFNYNPNLTLLQNVQNSSSVNTYNRCGQIFKSNVHSYVMNDKTEDVVANLLEKCCERGNKYFVEDYIYYDETKDVWYTSKQPNKPNDIYAYIICVDKIKVWTGPRSEHLMSAQNATNSLTGFEKRDSMKRPSKDMFLHEVNKIDSLMGTIARYKRTDNTQSPHLFTKTNRSNRTNINMVRGIDEFVLLNCIINVHNIANNPFGGSSTLITRDSENNNSLTLDSGMNAVINGITVKSNACKNQDKNGFLLTQMASFGTHKSVINFDEFLPETNKSKMTESELALEPLSGVEIQVHEACFNCSAVKGSRIMPDMKKKGCQLFQDRKACITSLALNNAKGELMKISNSLIWNILNTILEILCWKKTTHKMDPMLLIVDVILDFLMWMKFKNKKINPIMFFFVFLF